uniref:Ribosomal protein S7 n=1 Tax=Romanomermis culicivorax TaxID=13658 RepID=A0A915J116_ROMCU
MIATIKKRNKPHRPAGIVANTNAAMTYRRIARKVNKHAKYTQPVFTKKHIAISSAGHRPS